MGLFRKKKREPIIKLHTNSFSENMNRLTPEGDLPWGWITANKGFVEKTEAEYHRFFDDWYVSRDKGALKEYAALKSLVLYMDDVQKLCKSKGECFVEWSSIMVASPEDLCRKKARLKHLEDNMDELLQQEKRTKYIEQHILPTLRKTLIAEIKSEPGILQATLTKMFDPDIKQHISSELYQMEKAGLIIRVKSGRTYAVYPKTT